MKLSTLVETSTSGFGLRFGLVGLLPTTLLVLFILALLWGGAPRQPPSPQAVIAELVQYDTVQGLLIVIAILVLSLILQPFQLALVRLMEGYWGGSMAIVPLAKLFTAWQRLKLKCLNKRLNDLQKTAKDKSSNSEIEEMAARAGRLSNRIKRFYPKGKLLPTKLGNVLRAAEMNAGAPYGLDVITVWPRLYTILPERTAALIDDQRNQLDIAVRFCATFGVATLISLGLLYQHGWWLVVPATTFILAWLSYRGAIVSALAYGIGIRTTVDLHRFDLLRALHLPLPKDRETEKQMNEELSKFLRQGLSVNFQYDHEIDR